MGYMSSLHIRQHPGGACHPPLPGQTQKAPKCPGCGPSQLLNFPPAAAPGGGQAAGVLFSAALRHCGRTGPPHPGGPGRGAAGAAPALGPGSREGGQERPPAPRRGLGGRAGAGAAGSPSDGEMWPFTFTLQCQHLNHCRSARAQGCSRAAANKAAAGPPPPPGRPEEGTRAAPPSSPPLLFLLALSVVPKPYLGDQAATVPAPNSTGLECRLPPRAGW